MKKPMHGLVGTTNLPQHWDSLYILIFIYTMKWVNVNKNED